MHVACPLSRAGRTISGRRFRLIKEQRSLVPIETSLVETKPSKPSREEKQIQTVGRNVPKPLAWLPLRPIFLGRNQLGMQLAWKVISQSDFDLFFLEP